MKHWNEEDLIEFYYGESKSSAAIGEHLRGCEECSERYTALSSDLFAIQPPATPFRDADYGAETWEKIRGSVTAYPTARKSRFGWPRLQPWFGFAMAAACLLIIAVSFFAGRRWEHHSVSMDTATAKNGADQGRQRVVLVVLGEHLDRSERLLVELKHAQPSREAPLRDEARDLLSANRLYREDVRQAGEPALTAALDHLERVLTEVANEPAGLSQARLDELQKEMNTDGLLFEVRVLRSRVQGDLENKQNTTATVKGVSI